MPQSRPAIKMKWRKIYLRVPLIYAGVGVLWILFSDQIVSWFVKDVEQLTRLQMFKGWFFVGVTALLLLLLLRREVRKLEASHRALAKSEAKFKAIFNQTFQFVGLLDPQGTTIAVNDTALAFAGLEGEGVIGKPFWETPWWSHSEEIQEQLKTAILKSADGQFVRFETTNLGAKGALIDIDFSLKPVHGKDGKVLFLIPEGRDITDKKHVEAELAEYRTHLEELVLERTSDLKKAQDELFQKEKLATLGKLTSTVSHELRNPLGSIRNAFYTIEHSIDESHRTTQIERSLQFADRNIRRCVKIIDQLLDFARDKEIHKEQVDLDEYLVSWTQNWGCPDRVQVSTELNSGALVHIDREYFGQAIERIVSNSVEAFDQKPEGGDRRIRISTALLDNQAVIRIDDNGPGIPDEILDRIHEPLFSTKGFGVGLGIPYAHDILAKHSATLSCESEEGVGTTFIVTLPVSGHEAG